ncbi:zinc transporter ZIP1 isoform X2 [Nothobranchius furzeri]|uniref:zinc transporter ZIP1 isoform X2 n=1 Tax=Nothobranchius furzeri TaxID=105023 RepID=UPI0024047096|nr:zinc transporter ZIP1 isoform X2 [Nothobranchius furzeri]
MMLAAGGSSSSALQFRGGAVALPVNPADVPALEIKLGALVVLLSITLVFGFAPLCIVRGTGRCSINSDVRRRLLSLISCFAGGVFLATCLLDLLPDFLQGIREAFISAGIKLQFPLPEFIVAMGFFLVLVLEQIVLAFKDQPSSHHEERRALMADSSVQGLAVGLLEDGEEVLEICLALMIHKSIIAFSLSFKLTQGRLRRSAVFGCLLLFAIMSPLGIALGIGLTETKTSPQHQLARCSLEGMATGTFIYITFMEILPHELASSSNRILKVAMMLLGFALVTGVLFIKL